ncbi:hypothetical protein MXD81_10175, partial [Microbacteriaceae bacterium K1510]|nr:hypothetical protein [Microbacteriaceae bacterium K1510]
MSQNQPNQPQVQLMQAFPGSQKVYVKGSRGDIQVPMREISLQPTSGRYGDEPNAPVRVYDTSGPYTDPSATIDIRRGLPELRKNWIQERGDVEEYEGRTVKPEDDGWKGGESSSYVFPLVKT